MKKSIFMRTHPSKDAVEFFEFNSSKRLELSGPQILASTRGIEQLYEEVVKPHFCDSDSELNIVVADSAKVVWSSRNA